MKKIVLFLIASLLIITVYSCGVVLVSENLKYTPEPTSQTQSTFTSGREVYIVTYEISQSHITFDISEHIKDSMNTITMEIPVDKEYYDSLIIGQDIKDDFRIGSLIMKGSWGSWKVSVKDKRIEVI